MAVPTHHILVKNMSEQLHYGDFKVRMAEYIGYQLRSSYALEEGIGEAAEHEVDMKETYELMSALVATNCAHWNNYRQEKAHNEYIQSLNIPCE